MKKRYEILLALNTAGQEESNKDLMDRIEKTLVTEGAQVEQMQHLERRELAYPHNKIKSANFVNYLVVVDPAAITKIRSKLALDAQIILQNYLRNEACKLS